MAAPATSPLKINLDAASNSGTGATHALLTAMLGATAKVSDLIFSPGKKFQIQVNGEFVELEVTYTEPGIKGDTASSNTLKSATVETGAEVMIPLFVNQGDKIKVDTRTGEYVERVK